MRDLKTLWYIFPYFFLGHLVGDYILQNSYIAARKSKDLKVLLLHVFLIFASQLVFSLGKGFGLVQLLFVVLLSVLHFLIDFGKYKCKNGFCSTWWYYLIDQCLHLLSFLFVMVPFSDVDFFLNRNLVVVLCVMIFNAYFISFLVHFITSNGVYKRDYLGYLFRMVAPVLYYFSPIVFIVYEVLIFLPVWKAIKHSKSKSITLSVTLNYVFTLFASIILTGVML
ncbi:MAG: DUF3307 domain-containing protein [Fervidobacterium sp.]